MNPHPRKAIRTTLVNDTGWLHVVSGFSRTCASVLRCTPKGVAMSHPAGLLLCAVAPLTSPLSAAAHARWTTPRTPDGQPDLQGVWLSNSATPLERPKALEGRPFLTDDEVTELKKRADRLFKNGDSDYAAGDNAFLAAFSNLERYKNPRSTGSS